MKKMFLLLCLSLLTVVTLQAKKIYADLSQDQTIGKGTWVAAENTFSWTASSNARMVLNGFTGDLSGCTSLVLETSDYTASWRVDFVCSDESSTTIAATNDNGCKFYSAGTKTIDLKKAFGDKANLLSQIKEVRVNTNSASGSVKIAKAYLVQPMTSLDFGTNGVAELDFSDLAASGVNFDEATGVLTKKSDKSGTLSVALPTEGVDMSKVAKIEVEYEGDDLVDNLLVKDADGNKITQAYSSKYQLNFTSLQEKASHVATMQWTIKTNGSMTIKSIKFLTAEATGIETVKVADSRSGRMYNLNGVEVSKEYKGIVIVNGKKFVRR